MALLSRVLRYALMTEIMETFLGLMELLCHLNAILKEHVLKVEELQKKDESLQVH